jgi:polyhydroxyalkanoate synthesis regulator phasin
MADKAQSTDAAATGETPVPSTPAAPARRGPGHRGADVRDTVAEMAARAHEISQEAGSKMASAMKDVINAAAGLAGFAVESARDLVQYMVRRGQMTQEEADKLLREAEDAFAKRKPSPASSNGDGRDAASRTPMAARAEPVSRESVPAVKRAEPRLADRHEPKPVTKSAAKAPASKSAPKAAAKSPPKLAAKSPAKSPAKAAAKAAAKGPSKSAPRAAAKKGGAKKATAKRK